MKKFVPPFLAAAICLWAADFWQAKPFTDWSDKEAQKMETNSPWSKQIAVSTGAVGGPDTGRAKRSGGDLDSTLGSGGAGQHGQVQDLSGGATVASGTVILTLSWRTALPVREAVAKTKYGAEAGTSAEAKKMVDEEQKYYGVLVSGLPGGSGRGGERMRDALLKNTTLSVKGKDPIAVSDVQSGGNEQKPVVLFLFPRTAPISVDDKEVEFSTRFGSMIVRQKFHLKDMVFNGKLEL
ncbi:MAG: hypothetical protein ABSF12_06905 [Bryobacteraceae bacterium]